MADGYLNQGPQPPVIATDPATTTETQNAPNGTLTPPQAPPQPQIQQVPVPVVPPHVGKLASIGHVFSTLAGTQNNYSIDPNTGQTIASPVKQAPGQMFRNMLAGALMGGATGGQDFGTGFMRGGNAAVQQQNVMDAQRRAQAQQQFQNQLVANREQREAKGFESSEQLKQAEIAHANVQTARENQLIQGESFKQHVDQATFGKAQLQPYIDAGAKPAYTDIGENEMNDLLKNSPGASKLLWEPTGTRNSIGPDGKPTYEMTYSAVTPVDVTVSQGMLDTFRQSGMDKYDPQLFDVLKVGAKLSAQQYGVLTHRAQELTNTKLQNDKTAAETNEANMRAKQAQAAAAKDYAERDNYLEGKTKQGAFNKALANLNKVGDFQSLSAGDKLILGESAKDAAKASIDAYKAAKANNDEAGATQALQDYEFYNGLVRQSFGQKPAPSAAAAAPPAPGTPAAEAAQAQKDLAAQHQQQTDSSIVNNYMSPNKKLMMEASTDPQTKNIYQTLKKHKDDWSTAQKADFIRQAQGTGGKQWSSSAWQAANPGKDVNAAIAAAKQAGYQVTN